MINYIISCLDTSKFKVHSDLEGSTTPGGGNNPINVCITALKPDITIYDDKKNTFNTFELTCPMEPNIKKRNTEKTNKYAHFLQDITCHKQTLTCFEVGARGYISPEINLSLKTLHQYCKPEIKLRKFKENISALSIYSSYAIFCNRKEPLWLDPGYLSTPFMNQ